MPHSICSRRQGFSLVEVVASVFLIGTLLVATLVAHRRAATQTRRAQQRLAAIEALEELLIAREGPDADEYQMARGKVPGENRYHWRSVLRDEPSLAQLGAGVLRIELFDPAIDEGETLASVELLAPDGELYAPRLH
jgi:prepilin-type N-terminal cleavage/methylation domain-containing protein